MAKGNKAVMAEEARWRAEDDARTLARAREIIKDPGRAKAASRVAGKMAREKRKELEGLVDVARRRR